MRSRLFATAGLAGAGLGSVLMADILDRRRIEADPPASTAEHRARRRDPHRRGRRRRPAARRDLRPGGRAARRARPRLDVLLEVLAPAGPRPRRRTTASSPTTCAATAASGTPDGRRLVARPLADDLEAVLVAAVGDERPALLAGPLAGRDDDRRLGRALQRLGRPARQRRGADQHGPRRPDHRSRCWSRRRTRWPRRGRRSARLVLGVGVAAARPRPDPVTHRAVRAVALSPSAGPGRRALQRADGPRAATRASAPAAAASCRGWTCSTALEHLNVPTLVIAGERDRLTPPAHSHRLAEALPDSRGVLELEGSGHMGPLERPAEVNRALRELVAPRANARRRCGGSRGRCRRGRRSTPGGRCRCR